MADSFSNVLDIRGCSTIELPRCPESAFEPRSNALIYGEVSSQHYMYLFLISWRKWPAHVRREISLSLGVQIPLLECLQKLAFGAAVQTYAVR